MKQDPRLSEFEAQILHYEELENQINSEAEYYNVGPIALYTGEKLSALVLYARGLQVKNLSCLHLLLFKNNFF